MSKTLDIRIKDTTLEQIDYIQSALNAPSKSDVVRRAVGVTEHIIKAISRGDTVIIRTSTGFSRKILIPGLNYK